MDKNKLIPGEVKHTKMGQVMVAKNTKPDQNAREFPYDYIYYNYYRCDDGFIVYQEMYDESKNKQLHKMYIPDSMVEDFIAFMAGEKLIDGQ